MTSAQRSAPRSRKLDTEAVSAGNGNPALRSFFLKERKSHVLVNRRHGIGKHRADASRPVRHHYVYDEDEIIEEVKNQLEDIGIEHTEEFEDDFENFKYELSDCVSKDGFFPNMVKTVSEFLDKYLGDYWWESSNTWGRSISKRVYLWVAGLNMAVEQLDKEGILTKED